MRILEMSLQASAIIFFAALLRGLAGRRLPRRGFMALWMLAAARMLLPGRLPFRYGAAALLLRAFPALGTLFPRSNAPQIAQSMARAIPAARSATFALNSGGALAANTVANAATNTATSALDGLLRRLSTLSPWRVAWLAGLIVCALALLLPHLRWRRVYARSLPLEDADVDAWLAAHPLRLRRIRVRLSDEIPAPLTYGLFKPVILLPSALDRSDAARLHPVLLHEFTHIRRFDLLAKLAFAAALCAHWFNPLAWLMHLLANRDIELACDEAALRGADKPARRRYAELLLELAARQSGLPSPLASGFGGRTIEERIGAIMNHRKTSKFAALLCALLVLFAALGLATSAEETIPPKPEMEALLFDGWEALSLRDYRARIYALTPAPDALKGQENYNDPRYTDFLRFVLEPLTEGEWADGALFWAHRESCGSMDADSGRSAAFDFRVRCDVPDATALTAGDFRDKLAAVLNGMEDINPLTATQASLDARANSLAAANSDATIEFRIEAEIREDAPASEEPADTPVPKLHDDQASPEGNIGAVESELPVRQPSGEDPANTPEPKLHNSQASPEGNIDAAESELRTSQQSSAELAEALLFDGWEEASVWDYRAHIDALNLAPDALQREGIWNDPRCSDILHFVVEPLTEGEWTDGALFWTHRESCGSMDQDSGRSAAFDFRVLCDVPDTSALTAGEFRDKLAAVLNGMEDIDPLTATQPSLDARANSLAAANSDATVEFQIEAEIREDAPASEEPADTPEPELPDGQTSPEELADVFEADLPAGQPAGEEPADTPVPELHGGQAAPEVSVGATESDLRAGQPSNDELADTLEPELPDGQVTPEGSIGAAEPALRTSQQSSGELSEALLFDGWEEASVRDYAAIIAALPEIEDPDESGLPGGYLQYIYYPLLRAELDSPQTFSGASIDAGTGETLMNYKVSATITDPDKLSVGELRDALRGVRQGLECFDCESATQDDLQAYVMDLAERGSDGESIAIDILAELPGPDSPYADAPTLAHLAEYAPLGLEYDYTLGNLSLRYRGEEFRAVIDPEAQITISNSAGPEGLGGSGPFLLVEYANGKPAALRPLSPEE